MGSEDPSVRQKVTFICSHINTRIKSDSSVLLPLEQLVQLFQSTTHLAVVSFCLVYIQMGFARVDNIQKVKLFPGLLRNAHRRPISLHPSLVPLLIQTCALYPTLLTGVDTPRKECSLLDLKDEVRFLFQLLVDLMLYKAPPKGKILTAMDSQMPQQELVLPPGMSKKSLLNMPKFEDQQQVAETKISVMRFTMMQDIVPDLHLERFILYLIGSVDSFSNVQSVGDEGIKRYQKPDFESLDVVQRLYSLYHGFHHSNQDYVRSKASTEVKIKIIEFLCKSSLATNTFPHMIQTSFDALYSQSPKLEQAAIQFMQWIFRMVEPAKLEPVGQVFLDALLKIIDRRDPLRGFAYEAVGLLSKKAPKLFDNDLVLLKFFSAFDTEDKEFKSNVKEGLIQLMPQYQNLCKTNGKQILQVLSEAVKKPDHQARYCAVRYCLELFPFSDPVARYICLCAAWDPKLEIRETARKGLQFPPVPSLPGLDWHSPELQSFYDQLPPLDQILECFQTNRTPPKESIVPGTVLVQTIPVDVFTTLLVFCRHLIISRANPHEQLSFSVTEKPVLLTETRDKLFQLLQELNVEKYLQWIERGLLTDDQVLLSFASHFLVELMSFSSLHKRYQASKDVFLGLVNGKPETSRNGSHLLGLVCTSDLDHPDSLKQLQDLIKVFLDRARDHTTQNREKRGQAIVTLGYLVGRSIYRYPFEYQDYLPNTIDQLLSLIHDGLLSGQDLVPYLTSLSETARYGQMPLEFEGKKLQAILEAVLQIIKTNKEPKIQEEAILALGHLCLGTTSLTPSALEAIKQLPMSLSKSVELHFNLGETISCLLFGFDALHMKQYLDIPSVHFPSSPTSGLVNGPKPLPDLEFIKHIIEQCAPTASTANRKAASIWLMCLVKFCGHLSLRNSLLDVHQAFSNLLADRDEFVQEMASKGIGLCYEIGDQQLKDRLVQDLVNSLSQGKKLDQNVTRDTTLFESSIGTSPDGTNITTYQSVLSLAADMNQPDLVYRFMSLASHHAIWNSRRGASMGFSLIAKQAEEELKPFLPELIPRLYRFRFDPNPKVAQSMQNIWRALVKEPVQALNDHFEKISRDILKNMGDRQWRNREASCGALVDLLVGRQIEQLEPYLEEYWTMSFRALDDIKESVRQAGLSVCKALTNTTLKYCDPDYVSIERGQKMVNVILPFLLTKGIGSMSEDVRNFTLQTLLKLTFLESLSVLEPQMMNYLTLNADKYNLTSDIIDQSRLQAAKQSPILEQCERLVPQIDDEILKTLVPKLIHIIRKGVGLPTRAGTARYLYFLVSRLTFHIKPFADDLLKALLFGIQDRSPVVRKSFATALGHLAKYCSATEIDGLVLELNRFYLDSTDDDQRSMAPIVYLEISRHSPDCFPQFRDQVLPLAFMGQGNQDQLSKIWTDLWEENTAGNQSAIRQMLDQLLDQCKSVLQQSASWTLKKQVGQSLKTIFDACTEQEVKRHAEWFQILQDHLSGRTFDGKEKLLEAYGLLSIKSHPLSPEQQKIVEDLLLRESKKQNIGYKRVAIQVLGQVFEKLQHSKFEDIYQLLIDTAEMSEDDMDVDEDKLKPTLLLLQATCFKTIGQCFSGSPDQVLVGISKHMNSVWNVKISILDAIDLILKKSHPSHQSMEATLDAIVMCLEEFKYSAVREKGIKTLETFMEQQQTIFVPEIKSKLQYLTEKEPMPALQLEIKRLLSKLE
ncbi:proteasome stabiliser-domain-containing protein [Gorgonomyces haynaldii]|nr:proteasome stabiliser-domain-containing protein [Gorgonomyces haynaldii]